MLACPALVFAAPAAVPAVPATAPAVAQPKPASPAPAAAAVSAITEAAVRGGVLTCAKRIEQVAKYLTGGTQSGAFLFMPAKQPDQGVFSASFEIQSAGSPIYASASFSPVSGGACEAVYDAVEYSTRACAEVQRTTFQSAKPATPVKKDIGVLNAGPVKIFFMPAGGGCVVIRKEVIN